MCCDVEIRILCVSHMLCWNVLQAKRFVIEFGRMISIDEEVRFDGTFV